MGTGKIGGATADAQAAERRRIAALPFDKALAEFHAVVQKLETGCAPSTCQSATMRSRLS